MPCSSEPGYACRNRIFTQIVQIVAIFDDLYFPLAPDGVTVDGFFFSIDENRGAFAEVGDEYGVSAVRVRGMHGVRLFRLRPLRGGSGGWQTQSNYLPVYSLRRGILFDRHPPVSNRRTNERLLSTRKSSSQGYIQYHYLVFTSK